MKDFAIQIDQYYVMGPIESMIRTANYVKERELIHAALGLAGEAGEVVDLIKKSVNYNTPLLEFDLLNECGDTLHYLTRILSLNGFTLQDAVDANLTKLSARFPTGYSNTAAIERKDIG